jgi:hypothetical protein
LAKTAKSIRSHFDNLRTRLPYDLIFKFSDTSIHANNALYSAASPYFHDLIRRECFDKKNFKLELKSVSYEALFRYVDEFVTTGGVSGLWRMEQSNLLTLLRYATSVQLLELSELCEDALAKYLTKQNVCAFLLKAKQESLNKLKQACFDFINREDLGIFLEGSVEGSVECKFLNYSDKALDLFEKIKPAITHLIFPNDLSSDQHFAEVVRDCPALVAIDLSHSVYYSDYMSSVPKNLEELNLSACEWLMTSYLKKIIDTCPSLHRLFLASNVQLTAHSWGELMRLKGLQVLNLSHCQQIRDDDFRVILHACTDLTELNLEDCRLMSEKAFYDLARACNRLQRLNLARTNVTDASAVDIANRCRSLQYLDFTRCERLTDKGIFEVVKNGFNLQEINITSCHVNKATIDDVRKLRPRLRVVFSKG